MASLSLLVFVSVIIAVCASPIPQDNTGDSDDTVNLAAETNAVDLDTDGKYQDSFICINF